jgi:hypothetical protein
MKAILLLTIITLFSGCMHSMMMGGHEESQSQTIIVLEKEVTAGNIKAVATIPPFQMEKEVTISVTLLDKETSSPVSGAEVVGHFMPKGTMNNNAHQHEGIEIKAKDGEDGYYTLAFTPAHADEYSIHIQVRTVQGRPLEQPITIEATREVSEMNHGGMHDSGSSSSMYIIGGIVMITMMVGMLFWRGGMF